MAFPYTRAQADWQSGSAGGTPITEAALDTIEAGIKDLSDILALVNAKGDILAATAADAYARLAVGSNDQALVAASGESTGLKYAAVILQSLADAKGDIIAATAADTFARLAVGANGKVLKANSAQSTGLEWGNAAAWGITFTAQANEPPAASFATLDTRNSHAVLDFDAAADENAVFRGILPASYAGAGVNVKLIWAATSATSGTCRWAVAWERIPAGALDIDADSFATANTTGATADATSGETTETTIAFSNGGQMDSLAAGEMFRLKVTRDADGTSGTDDMTGDAELLAVVVTEQ